MKLHVMNELYIEKYMINDTMAYTWSFRFKDRCGFETAMVESYKLKNNIRKTGRPPLMLNTFLNNHVLEINKNILQ